MVRRGRRRLTGPAGKTGASGDARGGEAARGSRSTAHDFVQVVKPRQQREQLAFKMGKVGRQRLDDLGFIVGIDDDGAATAKALNKHSGELR